MGTGYRCYVYVDLCLVSSEVVVLSLQWCKMCIYWMVGSCCRELRTCYRELNQLPVSMINKVALPCLNARTILSLHFGFITSYLDLLYYILKTFNGDRRSKVMISSCLLVQYTHTGRTVPYDAGQKVLVCQMEPCDSQYTTNMPFSWRICKEAELEKGTRIESRTRINFQSVI